MHSQKKATLPKKQKLEKNLAAVRRKSAHKKAFKVCKKPKFEKQTFQY